MLGSCQISRTVNRQAQTSAIPPDSARSAQPRPPFGQGSRTKESATVIRITARAKITISRVMAGRISVPMVAASRRMNRSLGTTGSSR